MKPIWVHNCHRCIFLFTWNNKDFYKSCDWAPLLVRYSSEGSEYTTLLPEQYSRYFPDDVILRIEKAMNEAGEIKK